MPDICENCGRDIGDQETPHLFRSHIVCEKCNQKLLAKESARAKTKPTPPPAPIEPEAPSDDEPASIDDLLSGEISLAAAEQPAAAPAPTSRHSSSRPPQKSKTPAPLATSSRNLAPAMPMQADMSSATGGHTAESLTSAPMIATSRGYRPIDPALLNKRGFNTTCWLGLVLIILSTMLFCIGPMSLVGLTGLALAIWGLVKANERREGYIVGIIACVLGIFPIIQFVLFFIVMPEAMQQFSNRALGQSNSRNSSNYIITPRDLSPQNNGFNRPPGGSSYTPPVIPSRPTPRPGASAPAAGNGAIAGMPPSLIERPNRNAHFGKGTVTWNDMTVSLVSIQSAERGDPALPPRLLSSGPVLMATVRISVPVTALKAVTPRSLGFSATLYYEDSLALTIPDPDRTNVNTTIQPGESRDVVYYFPKPKSLNIDMAIEIPGPLTDLRNTLCIVIPAGYTPPPLPPIKQPGAAPSPKASTPAAVKPAAAPTVSIKPAAKTPKDDISVTQGDITVKFVEMSVMTQDAPGYPKQIWSNTPLIAYMLEVSVASTAKKTVEISSIVRKANISIEGSYSSAAINHPNTTMIKIAPGGSAKVMVYFPTITLDIVKAPQVLKIEGEAIGTTGTLELNLPEDLIP